MPVIEVPGVGGNDGISLPQDPDRFGIGLPQGLGGRLRRSGRRQGGQVGRGDLLLAAVVLSLLQEGNHGIGPAQRIAHGILRNALIEATVLRGVKLPLQLRPGLPQLKDGFRMGQLGDALSAEIIVGVAAGRNDDFRMIALHQFGGVQIQFFEEGLHAFAVLPHPVDIIRREERTKGNALQLLLLHLLFHGQIFAAAVAVPGGHDGDLIAALLPALRQLHRPAIPAR